MDNITFFFIAIFAISVFILGLALLTNLAREFRPYSIELKPNCLLTRHPVVFLTGPRSIFYFRKYWNSFPVLLAEHGYEVFTLHLPWQGPARKLKMQEFLDQQQALGRHFHFMMDHETQIEFTEMFANQNLILSQTVPSGLHSPLDIKAGGKQALVTKTTHLQNKSLFVALALFAHQRFSTSFLKSRRSASMATRRVSPLTSAELGAEFPRGSGWLLERMRDLAEQDFLR